MTVLKQVRNAEIRTTVGQGDERTCVVVAPSGAIHFGGRGRVPSRTHREVEAMGAYAVLGGETLRPYEVFGRAVTSMREKNPAVWRGLGVPTQIEHHVLDCRMLHYFRRIERGEDVVLPKHEQHLMTYQVRRRILQSIVACHYPNSHFDAKDPDRNEPYVKPECTVSRKPVTPAARFFTRPAHYNGAFTRPRLHVDLDWSWFRDVYLKGLAVVENHFVLAVNRVEEDVVYLTLICKAHDCNQFWTREGALWQGQLVWLP